MQWQLPINTFRWFIVATLLLLSGCFTVEATETLSPIESQGRQIYQEGQDGSPDAINSTLALTNTSLPATSFPCVNCHGVDGEGKVEGSLRIPPIKANRLGATAMHTVYDDRSLALAISIGKNPNAKTLDVAMPRYIMSQSQMAALVAYLKRLGSEADLDPGLSQDNIQLGSVLPLTGALQATGKMLKTTLDACIAEANQRGPIYGRRLSVVTVDSGSTDLGALQAAQRLLEENKTFAFLARYAVEGKFTQTTGKSLVPDLVPITFMPVTNAAVNPATFYILPSYADQARALVDYWLSLPEFAQLKVKPQLAIIVGNHVADRLTAESIRLQADLQGAKVLNILQWQGDKSAAKLTNLLAQKPAAVFFLGDSQEFRVINAAFKQMPQRPVLLSLMAMLGREVLQQHELAFAKVFLATPFSFDEAAIKHLANRLALDGVSLQNPGLQSVTCAAVDLLVEGLKRSGRHVSRLKLLTELETLHDFRVDFLPAMRFSPNNKIAVKGAYVLGLDGQGISQSEWITPKPLGTEKP